MTKVFILILTIPFVSVEAVPVKFVSRDDCEAAGKAWVESNTATPGWYAGAHRYFCIQGQVMP